MRAAAKNTIHKRRAARKVGRMAERLQYLRDGNKEKALEEPRI
jgi:ribosomal protein S20